MPEMIYLQETAPRGEIRGHVVGCTLPLQPVMKARWEAGDLHRVTKDGDPWPGGDFLPGDALPSAEAGPDGEPAKPRGNASQESWASYAVALGALSEDEAAGMTRDQIVAAVSAGEAG